MALLIYKSHCTPYFFHFTTIKLSTNKERVFTMNTTMENIEMIRNALNPCITLEADDLVYVSLRNNIISLFDKPDDVPTHRVRFARFAEEIASQSYENGDELPVFEEIEDGVYEWREVSPAWHDIDTGVTDGFCHFTRPCPQRRSPRR